MVFTIDTATQYTTYTDEGKCVTLPYYAEDNIYVTLEGSYIFSLDNKNLNSINLYDNSDSNYTIIINNPYADSCNASSANTTYTSPASTFEVGAIYQTDNRTFW